MARVNNDVYQLLKQDVPQLLLFRRICHSLQLAVSHAAQNYLPRNLEFLVSETCRWFSHSTLRQLSYQQLYQAIKSINQPLKLTNIANTRWLSIETPAAPQISATRLSSCMKCTMTTIIFCTFYSFNLFLCRCNK